MSRVWQLRPFYVLLCISLLPFSVSLLTGTWTVSGNDLFSIWACDEKITSFYRDEATFEEYCVDCRRCDFNFPTWGINYFVTFKILLNDKIFSSYSSGNPPKFILQAFDNNGFALAVTINRIDYDTFSSPFILVGVHDSSAENTGSSHPFAPSTSRTVTIKWILVQSAGLNGGTLSMGSVGRDSTNTKGLPLTAPQLALLNNHKAVILASARENKWYSKGDCHEVMDCLMIYSVNAYHIAGSTTATISVRSIWWSLAYSGYYTPTQDDLKVDFVVVPLDSLYFGGSVGYTAGSSSSTQSLTMTPPPNTNFFHQNRYVFAQMACGSASNYIDAVVTGVSLSGGSTPSFTVKTREWSTGGSSSCDITYAYIPDDLADVNYHSLSASTCGLSTSSENINNGIDGILDRTLSSQQLLYTSCDSSWTANENNRDYYQIDLQEVKYIDSVIIYHAADDYAMNNYALFWRTTPFSTTLNINTIAKEAGSNVLYVARGSAHAQNLVITGSARYIRIHVNDASQTNLAFSEIVVFGQKDLCYYSCDENAICTNTFGDTLVCHSCKDGYSNNGGPMNNFCDDIDECVDGTDDCSQVCTNTPGSYTCSCWAGFTLSDDEITCVNIDECSQSSPPCSFTHGICSDLTPSGPGDARYVCSCDAGYSLNDEGTACVDNDECATGTPCQQICKNLDGTYECSCNDGYLVDDDDDSKCVDENECDTGAYQCGDFTKCSNTVGSYECPCVSSGYRTVVSSSPVACEDINECETDNGGCVQTCTNTVGSFACSCYSGFVVDSSNPFNCVSMSACTETSCDELSKCNETPAEILILSGVASPGASAAFDDDDTTQYTGTAGVSFTLNTTSSWGIVSIVIDIPEAENTLTGTNFFGYDDATATQILLATIAEEPGTTGAISLALESGITDYTFKYFIVTCNGACIFNDVNFQTTIPAGAVCDPCPVGYSGSGVGLDGCVDIDECAVDDEDYNIICPAPHVCTNLAPAVDSARFSCECAEGYEVNPLYASNLLGTVPYCVDIDECSTEEYPTLGICHAAHHCQNSAGSFECSCDDGFTLYINETKEEYICNDIDECEDSPCDPLVTCSNIDGGFICQACPAGYVGDAVTYTPPYPTVSNCINIDECSYTRCEEGTYADCEDETYWCDPLTSCQDTVGNYTCTACPTGFFGTGREGCFDINECETGDYLCDQNCHNTDGSYYCTCDNGYELIGDYTCSDIDECALSLDNCDHDVGACENLIGSFECSCPSGYDMDQENRCNDIDECAVAEAAGETLCYTTCINQSPGYTCEACPDGYEGNPRSEACSNINECERSEGLECDVHTTCIDTPGSYLCDCPQGYEGDGKVSGGCVDIDECVVDEPCQHICTNYDYAESGYYYVCSCNEGYVIDPTDSAKCLDIDECAVDNGGCAQIEGVTMCVNTPGSHHCNPCPAGYVDLTEDPVLLQGVACLDKCGVVNGISITDKDTDGIADSCDVCVTETSNDPDSDDLCESVDFCPGLNDFANIDSDGDGIGDACDNCPFVSNVEQTDGDNNGQGDICQECSAGFFKSEDTCVECQCNEHSGLCNAATGVCTGCEDNTAGSYCEFCASGYYGDATLGACTACATGHYQSLVANPTSCTACEEGKYAQLTASARCTLCKVGTIAANRGLDHCSDCLEGTFMNSTGGSKCFECEEGYYQNVTGQSSCEICPVGSFSGAPGNSECSQCDYGSFTAESGASECEACPAGHYADTQGASACSPCPAGKYNGKSGSTTPDDCVLCQEGTFSLDGASTCSPCPKGTFGNDTGLTACLNCPVGTFGNETGKETEELACFDCAAGTFAGITGMTECESCALGTFSSDGATVCSKCSMGTYADSTGSDFCASCPRGTYLNWEGATSLDKCINCHVGMYSLSESSACLNCEEGTFAGETGMPECELCAAGSYQDAVGADDCKTVPAGYYQSAEGGIDYIMCSAGYYCPEGANDLYPCAAGSYSDDGASSCTDCAGGTFQPSEHSGSCFTCPEGHYCPEGTADFIPCPKGSFSKEGAAECTLCPATTYTNVLATVTCSPCPAGSKCLEGQVDPEPCALGRYSLDSWSSCRICDRGTFAPVTGTSSCTSCSPGHFQANTGQSHCSHLCSPGQYAGSFGQSACDSCAINTFSNIQGATVCTTCQAAYGNLLEPEVNEGTEIGEAAYSPVASTACRCNANFYPNTVTNRCEYCPACATCAGNETEPVTSYGCYPTNDVEDGHQVFATCPVSDVCLGGYASALCRDGHAGYRCATCENGWYMDEDGYCHDCPEMAVYVFFVFVLLVVFLTYVLLRMTAQGKTAAYYASVNVGFNFFQIIAIYQSFRVEWPEEIEFAFNILEFFNLNYEFVRPECTVGGLDYNSKAAVKLGLPLWFFVVLGVEYLFIILYMLIRRKKDPKYCEDPKVFINHMARRCFNAFTTCLTISYMTIANTVMMFYSCTEETASGRTYHVFDADPSAHFCYDDWWYSFLPYNILALVFGVLGIPALFFYILWYHRHKLDTEKTAFTVGLLFLRYKPDMFLWELAILARKLLISIAQVSFKSSASAQVLVILGILVGAFIANYKYRPFKSPRINKLEFFCLFTSVCVLGFGLILWLVQDDINTIAIMVFIVFVVSIIIVTVLVIVLSMYAEFHFRVRVILGEVDPDNMLEEEEYTMELVKWRLKEMFGLVKGRYDKGDKFLKMMQKKQRREEREKDREVELEKIQAEKEVALTTVFKAAGTEGAEEVDETPKARRKSHKSKYDTAEDSRRTGLLVEDADICLVLQGVDPLQHMQLVVRQADVVKIGSSVEKKCALVIPRSVDKHVSRAHVGIAYDSDRNYYYVRNLSQQGFTAVKREDGVEEEMDYKERRFFKDGDALLIGDVTEFNILFVRESDLEDVLGNVEMTAQLEDEPGNFPTFESTAFASMDSTGMTSMNSMTSSMDNSGSGTTTGGMMGYTFEDESLPMPAPGPAMIGPDQGMGQFDNLMGGGLYDGGAVAGGFNQSGYLSTGGYDTFNNPTHFQQQYDPMGGMGQMNMNQGYYMPQQQMPMDMTSQMGMGMDSMYASNVYPQQPQQGYPQPGNQL